MVLGFVFWGEGRVMVAECICFPLLLSYKAQWNFLRWEKCDGEASSPMEPRALSPCCPSTVCSYTRVWPEPLNVENGHEDVNFSFNFN